jgi:DNA-binding FrmR family transcriptional regulator
MQAEENAEVILRLRTSRGHLEAVIGMVETGEACESILHQLSAVYAALRAVGIKVLTCQLRQSQEIIRWSPIAADRAAELSRLLVFYRLLSRYSYREREQSD